MQLEGKSVLVLGLGRSGRAAAALALAKGAAVTVADAGGGEDLCAAAEALRPRGARVVLGPEADQVTGSFDLAVLSPGIDPRKGLAARLRSEGVPVTGEIELASWYCPWRIAGITGTNGKTTTTELTAHMLNGCGLRVAACGNVGTPLSTVVMESGDWDCLVVELSSFQLETAETFHPGVAVWTNFSPDHLDRYADVEAYRRAKLRIFRNQTAADHAVVNAADAPSGLAARTLTFSASRSDVDFTLEDHEIRLHGESVLDQRRTRLPGRHNAENLMAALGVAVALGFGAADAARAALDYHPPEHRCEVVTEVGGVLFVNDSKSTTLDSLARALEAQERPVILIAGGKDKGFGFEPVADLVAKRARGAILIGEMRGRIAAAWRGVSCRTADSLAEAVAVAAELARPGDVVLLSPGTSSYDMFRDYEARGKAFKAEVAEYAAKKQSTHTQTTKEKKP